MPSNSRYERSSPIIAAIWTAKAKNRKHPAMDRVMEPFRLSVGHEAGLQVYPRVPDLVPSVRRPRIACSNAQADVPATKRHIHFWKIALISKG